MESDADALIGRTLDGRYTIKARLGAGNVGAVYDATHVELRRRVAIKVLHEEHAAKEDFQARFLREARSVSRLNHPGCVALLDFGRIARLEPSAEGLVGMPYLVMEHVAGESLLDRLERGPVPAKEAIAIGRGALSALAHAHGLSIVHRDLKPANMILCPVGGTEPLLKIVDFGLAREVGAGGADQAITEAGMIFGTPSYLSPEQARCEPPDARSDLYSFAIVLFELFAGRKPFVADSPMEVVRAHLSTPAPRLRSIVPERSAELEAVLARALEKEAQKRFQSSEAMLAALEATPEAGWRPPPAPSPRRELPKPALLTAAGLVLLGLVATVALRARCKPALDFAPTEIVLVPPGAQRQVALAEEYQRKLWCADAIDALGKALREAPQLRASPEVVRIAIPCLRAKSQARTIRFLVEQIGEPALTLLRESASADPRAEVREGAQRALAALTQATP